MFAWYEDPHDSLEVMAESIRNAPLSEHDVEKLRDRLEVKYGLTSLCSYYCLQDYSEDEIEKWLALPLTLNAGRKLIKAGISVTSALVQMVIKTPDILSREDVDHVAVKAWPEEVFLDVVRANLKELYSPYWQWPPLDRLNYAAWRILRYSDKPSELELAQFPAHYSAYGQETQAQKLLHLVAVSDYPHLLDSLHNRGCTI